MSPAAPELCSQLLISPSQSVYRHLYLTPFGHLLTINKQKIFGSSRIKRQYNVGGGWSFVPRKEECAAKVCDNKVTVSSSALCHHTVQMFMSLRFSCEKRLLRTSLLPCFLVGQQLNDNVHVPFIFKLHCLLVEDFPPSLVLL